MGAPIRTVSCGCCTNGCYCFMHRPDRPGKGLSFACEYHANPAHPHPLVTSPLATKPTDQGNRE